VSYDLTAVLRLKDQFTGRMNKATGASKAFQSAAGQTANATDRMSMAAGGAGVSFQRLSASAGSSLTSVGGHIARTVTSIVGMGAAVGVAAVGWAAFAGTKSALKLAGDAEQAGIAFETMLGSAEKSQKFLSELKKYAADSPFDLAGLRDSSRQMLGMGFAVDRVLPMLRNFSDASAGLGLGSEGIKRLTLVMGQMQAKTKVQGDEILQMSEMGIPAIQMLADNMHVTQAAVLDMTSKGLVPANKAIRVILDGLDKRYGGLSDKQAKTLTGMYNKLKDTFDNDILKRWGDGIGSALYPRFQQLTKWIDNNEATITRWGNNIADAANTGAGGILSAFEQAYKYINTQYLNNPEFQKLTTLDAKVDFVINDVMDSFNNWYKEKGSKQVQSATDKLVDGIVSSIEFATPRIAIVATDLGTKIGASILSGAADGLKGSALGQAILNGTMLGTTLKAVDAATGGSGFNGGAEKKNDTPLWLKSSADAVRKIAFPSLSDFSNNALEQIRQRTDGSHAGGLDRVPYDGYVARLHAGERIQTKGEADVTRNRTATNARGPLIHVENMHVRNDSDIDEIARSLARNLMQLQGATA
jgi:tape measure domain-containing protein